MEVNGTTYKLETPPEVIEILERSRKTGMRLRLHYGDVKTGQDWGDTYSVTGRVGRSMGTTKIPLMIASERSMGGPAILDHCIVRIRHANRKDGGDLYRHADYKPPKREDYDAKTYERNFA